MAFGTRDFLASIAPMARMSLARQKMAITGGVAYHSGHEARLFDRRHRYTHRHFPVAVWRPRSQVGL